MTKVIWILVVSMGLFAANISCAAETSVQEKAKQEAKIKKNSLRQEDVTNKKGNTKIDLNKASKEEIMSIKGVGESLAENIIKARPFKTWDDVDKVKGIGDAKLKEIKKEAKL